MFCTKKFRVRDLRTNKLHDQSNPATHLMDATGLLWHFYPNGTLYAWKDAAPEFSSGLTDVKGKEIYEHDIVSCESPHHGDGVVGEVVFSQGCFILEEISWELSELSYLEVIGDAYQNPELLK